MLQSTNHQHFTPFPTAHPSRGMLTKPAQTNSIIRCMHAHGSSWKIPRLLEEHLAVNSGDWSTDCHDACHTDRLRTLYMCSSIRTKKQYRWNQKSSSLLTLFSRWIPVPVTACFLESGRGFSALCLSDYFESMHLNWSPIKYPHTVLDNLHKKSCSTSGNNFSTYAYVARLAIAGVGVARLTADKKSPSNVL